MATAPTWNANDVPNWNAQTQVPTDISNSFLGNTYTAPLFNLGGVAGNLGTMQAQLAPLAQQFMGGLFSNQLNPMEQTFLNSSTDDLMRAMNQQTLRMEGQFENSPFHSSLPQVHREILNDTTNNIAQNFASAGLQRQQLGTGVAQMPFEFPIKAADTIANASQSLFNMANTAFLNPYQIPNAVNAQTPLLSPTVIGGAQSSGGKLG